ncbi:helix-turn-helix domain-containing protein [Nocardia sp. CNY236]|uniref:helix-turn-helix domain-containing protein n=1 Tax=Nocardia sp. CNY236 TaxID=1169152 RepID=UPI000417DEEF|nr:helix-turn-helix transcriptional regulator [Nocardia sp. CNY236]
MFSNAEISGGLLRDLRITAGIGLRTMATRIHFTAGYLSLVETGRRPVTAAVLDAYRGVLDDPGLGLPGEDPQRLQTTMYDPHGAGASSLDDITAILERARHLEDTTGPDTVAPMVRGLDKIARALAAERTGGNAAATVAAEVAIYRGWLEHDTGQSHMADRSFQDATDLAGTAGDRSHQAHALSFRAFTAQRRGDTSRALDLTAAAIGVDGAHPILAAYALHQRAEILAMRGESRKAGKALAAAATAADVTDGIDLPSFGYWYTAGFWAVHRGVVLTLLGRTTDAVAEAEQGAAAMPVEHRTAGWFATFLREVHPEMT